MANSSAGFFCDAPATGLDYAYASASVYSSIQPP
jgi:hypothetical protein